MVLIAPAGPKCRRQSVDNGSFSRAKALLRVFVHDLQATLQAQKLQNALEEAERRLRNMHAENARLCRELHRRIPVLRGPGAPSALGNRAMQVTQAMVEYVRQHYHRPLRLADVAVSLRMNAAYLSSLFSTTLGVTFHQYLDELRLARAKELLQDPRYLVAEVASATGYASADQFRHAFKVHTGLSPSAWRCREQGAATGLLIFNRAQSLRGAGGLLG